MYVGQVPEEPALLVGLQAEGPANAAIQKVVQCSRFTFLLLLAFYWGRSVAPRSSLKEVRLQRGVDGEERLLAEDESAGGDACACEGAEEARRCGTNPI